MKPRYVTLLLVAAVALFALVFCQGSAGSLDAPENGLSEREPDSNASAHAPRDLERDREESQPAATQNASMETETVLVIRTTWRGSATAASQIGITIQAIGKGPLAIRTGVTDSEGLARFADIPAGWYEIATNRNTKHTTAVPAGKITTQEIQIATTGHEIRGVVVDARGRGIEGAAISLSAGRRSTCRELVVTHSAADGTFSIPHVRGRRYVAARSPEYEISRRYCADQSEDGDSDPELRIVLDKRGLELHGRVLDPEGNAIEGAEVVFGWPRGFEHVPGLGLTKAPELRASSDADGRFALASLPAGRHCIHIRAAGFAPLYEHVRIAAGMPAELLFRLARGVVLTGRVSDADGKAIPNALLVSYGLAHLATVVHCTRDGGFRLESLAAGTLKLWVSARGYDSVQHVCAAAAGDTVEWNPVLTTEKLCSGRLVDDSGRELPNHELVFVSPSATHSLRTDERGRFETAELEIGQEYSAYAHMPARSPIRIACPSSAPIRSGAKALEIRVPREEAVATIRARLSLPVAPDDDGDTYASLHYLGAESRRISSTRASDAKTFPHEIFVTRLLPGDYRLILGNDAQRFPEFVVEIPGLRSGELRDLGTLQPPPFATLAIEAEFGTPNPQRPACIVRNLSTDRAEFCELEGGKGQLRLAPGEYELQALALNATTEYRTIRLAAKEHKLARFELSAGKRRMIALQLPPDLQLASYEFEIRNARGVVVERKRYRRSEQWPQQCWPILSPGNYTVEVRTENSARLTGRFTIDDVSRNSHFLDVHLR